MAQTGQHGSSKTWLSKRPSSAPAAPGWYPWWDPSATRLSIALRFCLAADYGGTGFPEDSPFRIYDVARQYAFPEDCPTERTSKAMDNVWAELNPFKWFRPGGQVLVGHAPCTGHSHTTWWCRECSTTTYGPALEPDCSVLNGPAAVRDLFRAAIT
ncbi:hypothetical protein [Mycolicibacterium hippocampi]|uniref:hypothetical protein n=1 Tax=Mycolicibacterium hippocampi TaxID=659824 RepID=UPI003515B060